MTGTASSRGMSYFDVDAHRNQEWLRRRKLRLEQVRKQSNEIARELRRKVINEERARLDEYDRLSEAKFQDWKTEKLDELERRFRGALEDFGKGYKLAEAEPDPEEVREEKLKINIAKAQKRGEIAKQEELRRKKIAEEEKMSLIQRKKLVRKKEDLRSALIHSVPAKTQIIDTQNAFEEKPHPVKVTFTPVKKKIISQTDQKRADFQKKLHMNKVRRKKLVPQKSCLCKHKPKLPEFGPFRGRKTIWINLNEIQNSSTGDSSIHLASTKSSVSNEKSQKEKPDGVVEFYDFSSRYYRKSFKEFPHLVQRIDPETKMPNANDLAKIEHEEEKVEAQKKLEADTVSHERGMEALRREKISQDYNNLIIKLEELNRKEKVLKAQQRNLPNFLHMSDERLSERLKARQRLMDSKFENIYQEVMSELPRAEPPMPKPFCRKGGGDFSEAKRLSSSPTHVLANSLAASNGEPCAETSSEGTIRKRKKTKKQRQLLLDIDRALKEGRELREAISRNRELTSLDDEEESEKEKSSGDSEEVQEPSEDVSCKDEGKTTRCQESQTEDPKGVEVGVGEMNVQDFGKSGDDSLPLSTSTSYKSPPSVIRSYRLRQFLDYLERFTEIEGSSLMQNGSKYGRKIDKLLLHLLQESNCGNKATGEQKKLSPNPDLAYYIEKLLNMSREYIADLSVSSENISTPNITDLDIREHNALETEGSYKREDVIRNPRLNAANQLEETIRDWKRILEKNCKQLSGVEDAPDSPQPEAMAYEAASETKKEEPLCVIYSPKISSRYEEITKKCSQRISELSDMLDKVRKDKEKLLGSTSGGSSSSLNRDGRNSEKEFSADEEEEPLERCVGSLEDPKTSVVEGFLNRYNLPKPGKETVSTIAVADSQSLEEESLESWPDVMDELLKRKILTSPFKWSDGEYSTELTPASDTHTKPSSIETVIGNFRREMNKIKPFTVSDSFPHCSSVFELPLPDEKREVFGNAKKEASPLWLTPETGKVFQEESSVESINQALTTLGLNWAKSFLRKNEESKAISSSSNSDGAGSADEADDYL